jgi:3-mercaptopropionate dioxygenase
MIARLEQFVSGLAALVAEPAATDEAWLLARATPLMAELVRSDDWLPEAFAQPHEKYYQQYLLYADPLARFSVVSFVWGPGQRTPVHNHTVWGLIGMLRGAEDGQHYRVDGSQLEAVGAAERLQPGDVAAVSPRLCDVHRVSNAFEDRVSVSIHAYGGNIGRIHRSVFDEATGAEKPFVSGYANALVPNLWWTPPAA